MKSSPVYATRDKDLQTTIHSFSTLTVLSECQLVMSERDVQ